MTDVVIAGAGPAGSIAALVLARAGVRVRVVDRETFPREKLCGDTINPGGLELLAGLGIAGGPIAKAPRLAGMRVTGPRADVLARYGHGRVGCAIVRSAFDQWLLECAIAAGAVFESGLTVTSAIVDESDTPVVNGIRVRRRDGLECTLTARMTIAAEGRCSPTARSLNLIVHPRRPRRWAYGVYVEGVHGLGDVGEMHVGVGEYVGIAPIGNGIANVCVVLGEQAARSIRSPRELIHSVVMAHPRLRDRFADATLGDRVQVLGPLAVDARAAGVPGLLLAGDAAGFVDPMTGDGLTIAMRGAVLAAAEVRASIENGDFAGAPRRLADARRRAFGRKLEFNRVLRGLVESPVRLRVAGVCSSAMPGLLKRVISFAGDAA